MKTYNWGVLGCGVIANELALAMKSHNKKLYGVANRTLSKAKDFAKKYEIECSLLGKTWAAEICRVLVPPGTGSNRSTKLQCHKPQCGAMGRNEKVGASTMYFRILKRRL